MGAPIDPDGLKPVAVQGVCADVVGGGRIGTLPDNHSILFPILISLVFLVWAHMALMVV